MAENARFAYVVRPKLDEAQPDLADGVRIGDRVYAQGSHLGKGWLNDFDKRGQVNPNYVRPCWGVSNVGRLLQAGTSQEFEYGSPTFHVLWEEPLKFMDGDDQTILSDFQPDTWLRFAETLGDGLSSPGTSEDYFQT
ncbi:hypothetical protein Tco_1131777 [Tanacetum coccineum]|uniref:Uncharacterized protein n=1 Tax=Tanacetum coccineum TaxID=301880 RepID=A0ABQ5JB56_9ASTR